MSKPLRHVWRPLTKDGGVLWLKYWWGPGSANSLAFRLRDRSWAIVSPPCSAPAHVFDEIARVGDVNALIAPNAFHNMGQADWRARFPAARSYAPEGAHTRLAKKTPDVPYRPIRDLADAMTPVRGIVPDGMKTPDTLFQLPVESGTIWWLGDQFSNNAKGDQVLLLRLVSRILASGPGFWCNPKPEMVYVRDRGAWLSSMRAAIDSAPPTIVLCAHGDPVTDNAAARTQRAMDRVASRS